MRPCRNIAAATILLALASGSLARPDSPGAVEVYRKLTEQEPKVPSHWLQLGNALMGEGKPREALAAFTSAAGLAAPNATFRIATAHAALGEADRAFTTLDAALAKGFALESLFDGDPYLAKLASDPRYATAAARLRVNAHPCRHLPAYAAFDFWLGEWDVTDPQGAVAGRNVIAKVEDGCLVTESWTSARGPYTGRSLNYYDAGKRKWVQNWVDTTGTTITIEGGLVDTAMALVGTLADRDGNVTPFRGTWSPLPDGRVRQHFEQSTDAGKTWSTWFDGMYARAVK